LLTAYVGVSQARRTALQAANQAVPAMVQIRALVDTGASGTCVDPSVLVGSLGLSPTGSASVNTPTTGTQPLAADQYDVSILIPGATATHAPLHVLTIPVIAAELLQAQGFHALIGRDVLAECLLFYNGPTNQFTLAY
jgi:hypothetical protein